MQIVAGCVFVSGLAFCAAAVQSQELSPEIFPSEDELLQALELSEISFEQFILLQELAAVGIDATNRHLLDEVPNLSFFERDTVAGLSPLEQEQGGGFTRPGPVRSAAKGVLRWQFFQRLEAAGRGDESRYRIHGIVRPAKNWSGEFQIHREYTGAERWIRRTISFADKNGTLKRITLGNFSRRFGLGAVFGYRGKLFGLSKHLGEESLLFPDYGGHNGAVAEFDVGSLSVHALASLTRASEHSLFSAGGMVIRPSGGLRPGIILGYNRLSNRASGKSIEDIKMGLTSRYGYAGGYASVELTTQLANSSGISALVGEGRHKFGDGEIRYAFWGFANDYLDLSGGSKSASVLRRVEYAGVNFSMNSRRTGQRGFLVRSRVLLTDRWSWNNSLMYGALNSDSSNAQVSTGIVAEVTARTQLELGYVGRFRRRLSVGTGSTEGDQQVRLAVRYRLARLSLRSYLGYNTASGRQDFLSWLLHLKIRTEGKARLEFWSNLSRIESSGIGYWYIFARAEQELMAGIRGWVKLAHTFRRRAENESRPVVSFQLEAAW